MDISTLTFTELLELRTQVETRIKALENEEKNKAKRQIQELARAYGLNVEDVLNKVSSAPRKPVEAKYQNPNDPSQTWTGRGRKPAWVVEAMAGGATLETLAIAG